ncbi:hypothetical protein Tco_0336893, partial [Tanacetum coccineum]
VPGQEGAKGNVAEKKKVKESMEASLGKLLKNNDWSTSDGASLGLGSLSSSMLLGPESISSSRFSLVFISFERTCRKDIWPLA